ncbi:MAG: hypothetical protein ACOYNC_11900 [Bacteroidales bacterium]
MKNIFLLIFAILFFSITIDAQVSINTDNSPAENSAMLDVKSTSGGFLPPRMTTAQRNAIASPVEGLVIYNTEDKALNVYNGIAWKSMTPPQPFACGLTISINHVISGGVAPVNKTVPYGTVTGIPGEPAKCWITGNLGADHQATAVNDATEASAGWYWQFNRKQGFKHDGTTRTPNTSWITPIFENSDWISANDPCAIELGAGWRIPTITEWSNVDNIGNWNTWTEPYASGLKLHAAGQLAPGNGSLIERGVRGYYWSNLQAADWNYSFLLVFSNGGSNIGDFGVKATGYSVRCIRD